MLNAIEKQRTFVYQTEIPIKSFFFHLQITNDFLSRPVLYSIVKGSNSRSKQFVVSYHEILY